MDYRAQAAVFRQRRERLWGLLPECTVVLHNGVRQFENLRCACLPFRGNSHVIFFCGRQPPNAVLVLSPKRSLLFLEEATEERIVWEGAPLPWSEVQQRCGVDEVLERSALEEVLSTLGSESHMTLPHLNPAVNGELSRLLGRSIEQGVPDTELAHAIICLRLSHDEFAQHELRKAAAASAAAMVVGMRAVSGVKREYELRAEMECCVARAGMGLSFPSTLSVRGEVLHNGRWDGELNAGQLVLGDLGAETTQGYAGDITRVWPVSGSFSSSQRAIYDLVLEAQQEALALLRPGVSFREVHLRASRVLADGLIDVGILRGSSEGLVEQGVHALFFPHGLGHLVGLDVHDMEDLGDLAGYGENRSRCLQFGLHALRLDRELRCGMALTIEPGIYFIPALIERASRRGAFKGQICFDALERFSDVRGIRIEDTVLVTEQGHEVLTYGAPKQADAVEQLVK